MPHGRCILIWIKAHFHSFVNLQAATGTQNCNKLANSKVAGILVFELVRTTVTKRLCLLQNGLETRIKAYLLLGPVSIMRYYFQTSGQVSTEHRNLKSR